MYCCIGTVKNMKNVVDAVYLWCVFLFVAFVSSFFGNRIFESKFRMATLLSAV
jgi:hypothetical protein